MTAEEVAEFEKLVAEAPAPDPTPEERIAALEQDNAELLEAMDALLLGGDGMSELRERVVAYNTAV